MLPSFFYINVIYGLFSGILRHRYLTNRFNVISGYNKTLDEFTYADYDINQLIISSMKEIEFVGIRGYTKFDANGDPSGIVEILQQQGFRIS